MYSVGRKTLNSCLLLTFAVCQDVKLLYRIIWTYRLY